MAKLTEQQISERLRRLKDREEAKNARVHANIERDRDPDKPIPDWVAPYQAEHRARDAHHKIVNSEGGLTMYEYLETSAHAARDDFVAVLERCGVRFTDETYSELLHAMISLMNSVALAAVAFVSFEDDLTNLKREIVKQEAELANEPAGSRRDYIIRRLEHLHEMEKAFQ
jgi:hypothetical protein